MDLFSSPPPLAPPTSEGNELSWLRLLRSRRVGPTTFRRLIAEHRGDADAALDALPKIAAAAGVAAYTPCPPGPAQAELEAGRRLGAVPIFLDHPIFPAALDEQDDAPPFLWARGETRLLHSRSVAVVGARNASSLGLRMARRLAAGLGARGLTTVSGAARGVDTAVHGASLETGTIAVLAGGIDVAYPSENAGLLAEIAENGLLLSEMPPGLRPQARHFPRRNRIIAGLGAAVVVIEAAAKSGSLITARDALDLGREVMAVPGHPLDARAAGCNMLLRDGATLVRGADDVLSALAPAPEPPAASGKRCAADAAALGAPPSPRPSPIQSARPAPPPDAVRAAILERLGVSPSDEDAVLRDSGVPRPAFAASLTELELEGLVVRAPGGMLARPA